MEPSSVIHFLGSKKPKKIRLKRLNFRRIFFVVSGLVVRPGFEPGQAEPKSAVLPLHHRTAQFKKVQSYTKNGFYKLFSSLGWSCYFCGISVPSAVMITFLSVSVLSVQKEYSLINSQYITDPWRQDNYLVFGNP